MNEEKKTSSDRFVLESLKCKLKSYDKSLKCKLNNCHRS